MTRSAQLVAATRRPELIAVVAFVTISAVLAVLNWQPIFDTAGRVNLVAGPAAWMALCYRAGFGAARRKITYWPLFLLFIGYVTVSMLGRPTGVVLGRSATYLSVPTALLNVALIYVAIWRPGPLVRLDPKEGDAP